MNDNKFRICDRVFFSGKYGLGYFGNIKNENNVTDLYFSAFLKFAPFTIPIMRESVLFGA